MRYLATLMMVRSGDDYKLMALSEHDDVYVVMQDDATDDMKKLGSDIAAKTGMTPFAHICTLEVSK